LSILDSPPKLINANWQQWAQRTATWLAKTRSTLRHKVSGESAAEDGVLLWEPVNKYPVVSVDGDYVALLMASGYTVAALPTGVVGQRAYVTDANGPVFGSAVAGGGAVVIPVFRNATAWIVG
jgi:hypothetical protein|tara:strand:+ start:1700 stop:2068 length:369 start_codon:yes stop_codon:yes gene_type:complete